ncbi:MAG: riboflavin synthase [Deltaproteobacteria bacterium]|nr:riboflavin synthase [Deltaproteobacteria bacterium]
MFTGLVQTTGRVRRLARRGPGARLELDAALGELVLGESIAVAGACLTVDGIDERGFAADVSAESLACSTLGQLRPGRRVNLERACRLGDRLGGHLVLGHVDGVGRVLEIAPGPRATRLVVAAPEPARRYLAPKGSVAIDGVSLTVNELRPGGAFAVMLVAHTLGRTTLAELRAGDGLNVEADVLARYVAAELGHAGPPWAADVAAPSAARDAAIMAALERGGFLA